ncbi:hypothetical protein HS7_03020 [Sulfolobales archaeon HS-7]|nr:hypothetical protein HS7_03020 [Sulfolobales archaeon HS-7]
MDLISCVTDLINIIIGACIAYSGTYLAYYLENRRFPTLSFDGLIFNRFSESIRVLLKVRNNDGFFNVTNAICQISVKISRKGNNNDISKYIVECPKKSDNNRNKAWIPLVNTRDRYREVEGEPVSWNVWLDNSEGIENMRFKYLGLVPSKGFNMAVLMDIYKTKKDEYLLRINSEYGPEDKPKLILKLPIKDEELDNITVNIQVTGDKVRKFIEGNIIVKPVVNDNHKDFQIEFKHDHKSEIKNFSDLFNSNIGEIDCD